MGVAALIVLLTGAQCGALDWYVPPEKVSVKPVFLVPRGGQQPGAAEQKLLRRHLEMAQERYRELLRGKSTFQIEGEQAEIVQAKHPLEHYRRLPKSKDASAWVGELLERDGDTRFNSPFIYLIVVVNDRDRYPVGGGRPLNGGINTGGGVLVISTYALTRMPNFQSTLQHELGHTFGLPHVDVYGYDMKTNRSMMSYNPAHKTEGLQPSRTPGELIPEDLRALALNDRVFANLEFDSRTDVPSGYRLAPRIVPLGPMEIDGQPAYAPQVTTSAGEAFGTRIGNVVAGTIEPSRGPGVNFNPKTMYHSEAAANGIVTLTVEFPEPVELTGLGIHSEHSGKSHRAEAVRLEAKSGNEWQLVQKAELGKPDEIVRFEPVTSRTWRIHLKTGSSRKLVLRGLNFYSGEEEIIPQLVPAN